MSDVRPCKRPGTSITSTGKRILKMGTNQRKGNHVRSSLLIGLGFPFSPSFPILEKTFVTTLLHNWSGERNKQNHYALLKMVTDQKNADGFQCQMNQSGFLTFLTSEIDTNGF